MSGGITAGSDVRANEPGDLTGGLALFEIPGANEFIHSGKNPVNTVAADDLDLTVLTLGPEIWHVAAGPARGVKDCQPRFARLIYFAKQLFGLRRQAQPANPLAPQKIHEPAHSGQDGYKRREGFKVHAAKYIFGRDDRKRVLAIVPACAERIALVEGDTDFARIVAHIGGRQVEFAARAIEGGRA